MVKEIDLNTIRNEAECYYRNGDFYCSEAIVATIRNHFHADIPVEAVAMASGFPIGIGGVKCVCGALSGGILCIGYFFGRTKAKDKKVEKAMTLSNELYKSFINNHRVSCCSVLTKNMVFGSIEHINQCANFTGEVAVKTAEIIAREFNMKLTI
jgi:C_GCAxxG_C_C family probable redox protein